MKFEALSLGSRKSLGEWQIGVSEDIKMIWISTALQIPSIRLPTTCWEYLTDGSFQMAHRHP